jgi:hypothetical protein
VADLLGNVGGPALTTIGMILAAAWRAALLAVAVGAPASFARETLGALRVDEETLLALSSRGS